MGVSVSWNIRTAFFWEKGKKFFSKRIFLFFKLALKSAGFHFWKYKKSSLLRKYEKSFLLRKYKKIFLFRKYKKIFLLRKNKESFLLKKNKKSFLSRNYKNFFNIRARKFHFRKYKKFFCGVHIFLYFEFGLGSAALDF